MTFTPHEILTILNIFDKVSTIKQRQAVPEIEQNQRLSHLESEVADIRLKLSNDKKAIEDLQSTNALLIKGILALLEIQSHTDGTGQYSGQIKEIQAEMQQFLIAKGLKT